MKRNVHSQAKANLKLLIALFVLVFFVFTNSKADEYKYSDNWGKAGYTVETLSATKVLINYSVEEFALTEMEVKSEAMQNLQLPGHFLPNNEGAPNLPGTGRYIAIPQGAKATYRILSYRTETFTNINIAPAPRIPLDTETGPPDYNKDQSIYSMNKFYPEEPIKLSDPDMIRGVDMVILGITPFHYNPVIKELVVYRDLKIEVTFTEGNGHFGDDRFRSRWWDPLLADMLLNYESLPKIDYNKSFQAKDDIGCEYLIITPNGAEFQQWADSIKNFRTLQGILTDVVTVSDVGGNTTSAIESYINNAYNNWDIVPAACLLLGDYGTSGNTIISPMWNNYCVSDNIYADVSGNSMPDIVLARMTAQNATHLETMITKFLDHERTPPTNPDYYNNPITALGWQTDRWFQICSESVAGFWEVGQGKSVNRINVGPIASVWSTNQNTPMVLDVFGPNGLGYIPATPGEVNCTWNGNANDVINGVNNGAFMLQHRDHGGETGWSHPAFSNSNINSLTNTDLTFVWSINCLTGKFNYSGECFAEKFHRHTSGGNNAGALGIVAASEISYSFVNDTYVWGAYDNMWPDFLPDYGTTPDSRDVMPAFGNAGGKYFLQQSNWPYNTSNKVHTYNLFHHHGDAFMTVYSEIPQNLTVIHNLILYAGVTSFDITANEGSLIALTVNGEIIGTAEGTGAPLSITIPGQVPPDQVLVTITKQNYYRYESLVDVIPPTGPYVVRQSIEINDVAGNNNGIMETSEAILATLTVENVGVETAENVTVTLQTTDEFVTVTDDSEFYGDIEANTTAFVVDGFAWDVADNIPDLHNVNFEVSATDGNDTWVSYIGVQGHAPSLEIGTMTIDDSGQGNNNGRLDPGETVDIYFEAFNNGSFEAINSTGEISSSSEYLTFNNSTFDLGTIESETMEEAVFNVTVASDAPIGSPAELIFDLTSGGYNVEHLFSTKIGLIVEDWEDGDMSQFDWQTGGNNNWIVTTENPYEGVYCAKSGSISHNQVSWLKLDYEVVNPDSISFYFKVSSEGGWDYFKFYLNNTTLDSWSGEVGWQKASYAIPAGNHTFKWEYDKDGSVSTGSDCAWVDFIVLPNAVLQAQFAANNTEPCVDEEVDFSDLSSGQPTSWDWVFEGGTPATSTEQNPTVTYANSGTFDVTLTVSDGSDSETLLIEDYITVIEGPEIAATPTGETELCQDSPNSPYSTTGANNATSYNWNIDPTSAGSISGSTTTGIVNWSNDFYGTASISVQGVNNCGEGEFSDAIEVTIHELPTVTLEPFADVCDYDPAFELTGGLPEGGEYSGTGVTDGWFDPAVAGVGTHTITYTFSDSFGCENFADETIIVDGCTGISEVVDGMFIEIFPNPTDGIFTIRVKSENSEQVNLKIINNLGIEVYTENNISLNNTYETEINLSEFSEGLYYINLYSNEVNYLKKIIIQK